MGRKTMNSKVIGVEELGGLRREGAEDGGVPVSMGGEKGRLMRFGDMDDEGLRGLVL